MTTNWYEEEKKVIELAEFLVRSVEIESADELLEYFKHPDRYTEVWKIYEKDMLGTISTFQELSKKVKSQESKQHLIHANIESCSCSIS
jgi:hypothetical protein